MYMCMYACAHLHLGYGVILILQITLQMYFHIVFKSRRLNIVFPYLISLRNRCLALDTQWSLTTSMVRYSILDAMMHFVYNMCAGYIDPWPSTFARRTRIAIIDGYHFRSRQKAINSHCPTDPMWRERESNTDQRDIEQLVHGGKTSPWCQ